MTAIKRNSDTDIYARAYVYVWARAATTAHMTSAERYILHASETTMCCDRYLYSIVFEALKNAVNFMEEMGNSKGFRYFILYEIDGNWLHVQDNIIKCGYKSVISINFYSFLFISIIKQLKLIKLGCGAIKLWEDHNDA